DIAQQHVHMFWYDERILTPSTLVSLYIIQIVCNIKPSIRTSSWLILSVDHHVISGQEVGLTAASIKHLKCWFNLHGDLATLLASRGVWISIEYKRKNQLDKYNAQAQLQNIIESVAI
ncbi:hypothetical protein ACJX0J_008100, partial [Zea mays]